MGSSDKDRKAAAKKQADSKKDKEKDKGKDPKASGKAGDGKTPRTDRTSQP